MESIIVTGVSSKEVVMRYHSFNVAVGAIVAVAGFTPASLLILGSSTTTTDIAGGSGRDSRLLGPEGDYQGLIRITWAEDSDIPCYFKVMTRHINQNTTQTEDANLGGNSCEETERSSRTAGFNTPGYFINGIAVCRNNGRIKGIKAKYAWVSESGSVMASNSPWDESSGTQTNCSSWGAVRNCPNGKIATRIKIHHEPDNPTGLTSKIKESATGIALICRTVEKKL
jgi:hypothetical protein